jgi:hypothetical protein
VIRKNYDIQEEFPEGQIEIDFKTFKEYIKNMKMTMSKNRTKG